MIHVSVDFFLLIPIASALLDKNNSSPPRRCAGGQLGRTAAEEDEPDATQINIFVHVICFSDYLLVFFFRIIFSNAAHNRALNRTYDRFKLKVWASHVRQQIGLQNQTDLDLKTLKTQTI